MTVRLILGGARSGKSSFAEKLLKHMRSLDSTKQLHYVATAIPFDDEMVARIRHHQNQRGEGWNVHESSYQLSETLQQFSSNDIVLVDCLTLWLNNVIYNDGQMRDAHLTRLEIKCLIDVLKRTSADITLVSNEVGMGLVPEGEVSNLFVEFAGLANQWVADVSSSVFFVAAGLPKTMKG
ncbi:bifunctional adenosylcobinamide kinase/adenosylcobinamide-phosphate guanylyltransferase [Vibrio ziniensis]|uniref:Bifunctional adenosylcobalamin biosynthesis protein n=1 Tax=Vibrio ziniensis TaxID=2711221 RepID=A0A6G7CHJ3_9VIBR|nr:bifunctional adenosylcobinamide kinase/adenosylcobinamide-phosphate guanylyltransferase [Vibrio ziniensis]QIH41572.1 bifunctional adenosylcobinamide kinase/adenosylcobinamide-phosphate guanylyltransferase [Vibrio ziniensis]